ncbi:sulfotransferase [Paracoccus ravus]|uniref:sulfotransferase n=1 Tax=Paracoccus ravus TaxID=2447760 RepID=UPI00106DD506|nr:sulfotransferase [Paracoccus ravus]
MRPKVFVIGFNKCGTSSLGYMFRKSGMRVADNTYKIGSASRNIAKKMQGNVENGRPVLDGIDMFDAYSDMELSRFHIHIEGIYFFQKFDAEYPGSKFILNVRDKDNWIRSRSNHGNGRYMQKYVASRGLDSAEAAQAEWSSAWDSHIENVQTHFASAPSKLLVFDIETDAPDRVAEFLPEYAIDVKFWEKRNANYGWSEEAKRAASGQIQGMA